MVGVAGSPICGAGTTIGAAASLCALASLPVGGISISWMNDEVVGKAARPGRGLYVDTYLDERDRRGLTVSIRNIPSVRVD